MLSVSFKEGKGLINKVNKFLQSGDKRTALIKKNIVGSFGLKMIDVVIDFLLVPLSLAYLTQTDYGIWLIVSSMVNWLNFFDIGISHGYRNKLAVALSKKNYELAKTYTSTTYVIIGLISLIMALLGSIIAPYVNWTQVLNTNPAYRETLDLVMLVVIISFAMQMSFRIITSIFLANQLPFYSNLINVIIKVTTITCIAALTFFTKSNLYYYATVFSVVPLIVLFISTLLFFNKKYKAYRPAISHFDKTIIRDLMGLGIKFFIIQLGATMLFLTDNIIIAQVLSPADVTPYQIALKYFSFVLVIFAIIITPYWSSITEAYDKNEFEWIRRSISSLNKIWMGGVVITLILFALFYPVLKIWVGNDINVPIFLAIQCAIFVTLQTKNGIYTHFLNGTGKIFLQMLTGILTLLINIPLSIYFAKYLNLGSAGVLLATNCSILIYLLTRKMQYHKIINKRDNGIWAK